MSPNNKPMPQQLALHNILKPAAAADWPAGDAKVANQYDVIVRTCQITWFVEQTRERSRFWRNPERTTLYPWNKLATDTVIPSIK